MSFNEQFTDLLAIQKPCIQIRTNLEKELFPVLLNLLYSQQYESIYRIEELDSIEKITVSSAGKIIRQKVEGEYGPIQFNPNLLLGFVRDLINNPDEKENAAFIFMDYDSKFDNSMFRRWIKNIFELKNDKYAPFIFVSSKPEIPDDLKHLFSVVYYDNPTEKEIVQLLKDYKAIKKVEINDINNLAHKFIGFNRTDIIECLNYSFYKFGEINDSYIKEKRVEVIKKSSVIVYKEPRVTMTDIAGNHYFKQWYEELKYCFDSDAQKYGVNKPKGYLALGPAGTAKSLGAEAIASDLNVPLLSLDMSRLNKNH